MIICRKIIHLLGRPFFQSPIGDIVEAELRDLFGRAFRTSAV
jgi:hypothetical protein